MLSVVSFFFFLSEGPDFFLRWTVPMIRRRLCFLSGEQYLRPLRALSLHHQVFFPSGDYCNKNRPLPAHFHSNNTTYSGYKCFNSKWYCGQVVLTATYLIDRTSSGILNFNTPHASFHTFNSTSCILPNLP